MANVTTKVEVDMNSVEECVYKLPGTRDALGKMADYIAAKATALGAGYRTGRWHDHKTGETKGGKAPIYGGDVGERKCIGIVHPENYAAMKDNYLHNTMLKAK